MDNSQIVFENFLRAQTKFLEEAKWFEGERRHSDPTEKFILETITSSIELNTVSAIYIIIQRIT